MKNQDKTYCIYKHISPSGKVYVGQTCRKVWVRWLHNGNGYKKNPVFWKAIQKYGWNNFTHEVLLEGLSKQEADYSEKYLIKWYKLYSLSYNCTDGGEGTFGFTPWNKGLKNWIIPWNKGKAMSEETKRKVSEAKKGHKYGPQTALHIQHKVAVHKIPIIMGDIDDPNLWKPFASAKDAELYDKRFDRKSICQCLKNKSAQAYGYFWFYENQFTLGSYLDKFEAWERARVHYRKPVCPDWINKDGVNIINCIKKK